MQKLGFTQSLEQKLSPQQIQFIRLLQVPTAELDSKIEEELELNPALEEGIEDNSSDEEVEERNLDDENENKDEEINLEEYMGDDYSGYKMQGDGSNNKEYEEIPVPTVSSFVETLITQLGFLKIDKRQQLIGEQLIGSIESDGYVRRSLESIANDIAFSENIEVSSEEIEYVLRKIQNFDPPGIAARSLQECLLLQLDRKVDHDEPTEIAKKIVEDCFNDFTKKHYEKIDQKLNLKNQGLLKEAVQIITKLNPKPGDVTSGLVKTQYLIPDFLLSNNNGCLDLSLSNKNDPDLRISHSYAEMMRGYEKSNKKDKKLRETISFVKQKLDAAKWFIDAIKQRQHTLIKIMNAITHYQRKFFLTGDESKLRPMILKDIAEKVGMDISTISRVTSSKSIQTEFGVYPLKYLFSESINTDSGEDASNREVKYYLKEMIEKEDKRTPLLDDKLEKLLKAKGYNIARRTVAKYREQLKIPVARLRKEL